MLLARSEMSVERDILNLPQDMWANVGTQGLRCNQFDPPGEQFLQKQGNLNEVVESLATRFEFHQDIRVAIAVLLPTDKRAKKAQLLDTKAPDLAPVLLDKGKDLLFRLYTHFS